MRKNFCLCLRSVFSHCEWQLVAFKRLLMRPWKTSRWGKKTRKRFVKVRWRGGWKKWQRSPCSCSRLPSDLLGRVNRLRLALQRSEVRDSCLCEDIARTQHQAGLIQLSVFVQVATRPSQKKKIKQVVPSLCRSGRRSGRLIRLMCPGSTRRAGQKHKLMSIFTVSAHGDQRLNYSACGRNVMTFSCY